jgi:hypothetical protein
LVKKIAGRVSLYDRDAVEGFIEGASWSHGHKQNVVYAYRSWCEFVGFKYEAKKYQRGERLPYVPLERQLDQVIAAFRPHYAALL